MQEYHNLFICCGMIMIFGFSVTFQNYGFLKKDIKYLRERISKLESELLEIKYRR